MCRLLSSKPLWNKLFSTLRFAGLLKYDMRNDVHHFHTRSHPYFRITNP